MNAKEMFEELGYELINNKYPDDILRYEDNGGFVIRFDYTKKIWKSGSITMQELKAINKQCEELGWIK